MAEVKVKSGRNKVRKRKVRPSKKVGGVYGSRGVNLVKAKIRKKLAGK